MEASPAAPVSRTPGRLLLILTAAGLAARVAFLLAEPATSPVADERTWIDWARNLSSAKVGFSPFRTKLVFYPPLYHYFIAVAETTLGSLAAVRWAQVMIGALLVPAVGRAGALVFGEAAGLGAAAIAAFYPDLVWFSAHYWSETLFLVLLWWALERLLAADAHGRTGVALAAGLLWGLAILTRDTILYFTPLAVVWLATGRERAGRRAAVFLLASVVVVAPWTWRNWVVYRGFIPVATAGGLNLYQGNAPLTRQQVYDTYRAVQGRLEQYQFARRAGIQAILDRQPWWLFEKLRDELPMFWEADSLALVHIKRGAYGSVEPSWAAAAALVVLAPYLAVLALAVAGVAAFPPTRPRLLLLAFLAYYVAIHVATHGFARYRLPAMPVLFVFAAAAWTGLRRRALPLRGRRAVLAAAASAALVLCLIPSFRRNLGHPAFGFADAGDHPAEEPPGP